MAAIRRRSVTSLVRTWQSTIMRRAATKSSMSKSLGKAEPEHRLCSGKVAICARDCECRGLAQGTVARHLSLLYSGGANRCAAPFQKLDDSLCYARHAYLSIG